MLGELVTGLHQEDPGLISSIDHARIILDSLGTHHGQLRNLILSCLNTEPNLRPSATDLLSHDLLLKFEPPRIWNKLPNLTKINSTPASMFTHLSWNQFIYFWKLSGCDLDNARKLGKTNPRINTLMSAVKVGLETHGIDELSSTYDDMGTELSLQRFQLKLHRNYIDYDVLIRSDDWKYILPWKDGNIFEIWNYERPTHSLGFIEKGRNFDYSLFRFNQFKKLLSLYPLTRDVLLYESVRDIPDCLRGQVWAALLSIKGDPELEYQPYCGSEEESEDRQIDADIRRCHQVLFIE